MQTTKKLMARLILKADKFVYYLGRIVAHSRAIAWFPGKRITLDYSTVVKYPENIKVGNDVWIGSNVSLGAHSGIILEDRVRISHGAFIETASLDLGAHLPYPHIGKEIVIGEGVWISAHAKILGGVTIGRQAVIGAGALVTKDIPDNGIAVGNPARIIGYRTDKI